MSEGVKKKQQIVIPKSIIDRMKAIPDTKTNFTEEEKQIIYYYLPLKGSIKIAKEVGKTKGIVEYQYNKMLEENNTNREEHKKAVIEMQRQGII